MPVSECDSGRGLQDMGIYTFHHTFPVFGSCCAGCTLCGVRVGGERGTLSVVRGTARPNVSWVTKRHRGMVHRTQVATRLALGVL